MNKLFLRPRKKQREIHNLIGRSVGKVEPILLIKPVKPLKDSRSKKRWQEKMDKVFEQYDQYGIIYADDTMDIKWIGGYLCNSQENI